MKVLIVGAKGMLGTDLLKVLSSNKEVIGTDIEDFDITKQGETIENVTRIRPDILLNVAAFTQVDQCETERERAMMVNGEGVKNLAIACAKNKIKMLHVSTDYIFDGNKEIPYVEDDPPFPLSIYGRSKLLGERYLRDILSENIIIRTSWLFGAQGENFVKTILRLAQEKDELRVVDDQRGSPTYTLHLAQAINILIDTGVQGIFHITNRGSCTWYEFASEIVKLKGINIKIKPITTEEIGRPARRPRFSVLNCRKFESLTGFILPHWKEALKDFFKREGV